MSTASAPLSFGQELFWLLDDATPGLIAYNVPRAFRIDGTLDVGALQGALDAFITRHEVLRSVYTLDGEHPVQTVLADATVPVELVDLSALPTGERERALSALLAERAARRFDLARDVLLRATIVRLAERQHALLLLSHHIASDGWSRSVTYRELSELYAANVEGRAPALDPPPMQFADHARRERDRAASGALDDTLAYWRERLAGPLPVLDLPGDGVAGADPFAGGVREALLPPDLVGGMRRLGQEHGASLYMVLLAAYQTLLHRYSGQEDVVVGSPTAGRDDPDVQELVGYFAGALVQRTSFAGDPTFGELLTRVADGCLDAYEHADVPFEKLVLELQKGEKLTHAPLFQCVLTMEDTVPAALRLGDARVDSVDVPISATKFDLVLLFSDQDGALRLRLAYRTARFSAATAERFLGHLRTLLEAAVAAPATRLSALPLLTPAERAQLDTWHGASAVISSAPATVLDLFAAQVARVPGRPAVVAPRPSATAQGSVAGTVVLTYAELGARASQLAHHLRARGVAANVPVGLLLDHSADALVGLWGILLAGGAVVPLSVEAPAARIARQLAAASVRTVVTTSSQLDRLPSTADPLALDRDAATLGALAGTPPTDALPTPDDTAYILFTSGSTGEPKGVAVTHANAVHYARAISRVLGRVPPATPGDGFAALDGWHFGLVTTLSADLGYTSLWSALLGGGTLHVLGRIVATEPARFAEYVSVHQLDVLKITPGHLRALVAGRTGAELAAVLPREWTVLGGEALPLDLARLLVAAGRGRVLNHYGPTEATVGALTCEVTAESIAAAEAQGARSMPLGRPLADGVAVVLSAAETEQPVGVPGELWLGGPQVAHGYVGQPERTAERFTVRDGVRGYRTGDRVRRLADGTIEFLGRGDAQVKVRGFRVELDEIAARLRAHPGVVDGAVLLRGGEDGEPRLVAYVVPRQGGYAVSHADRPTPELLIAWVNAELPPYMVPEAVVLLDAMPRTANGKLDAAALPAPDTDGAAADTCVAPRTETEQTIARIWAEVLKKERVGVTDDFLDLGGHSLLAIRVLGRISRELGVRLALRTLFESATVERVAQLVDAERRQREEDAALQQALAEVEGLSDAEAARLLGDPSVEQG